MDTGYYKKYEPLFNSWYIKEVLGAGSFGTVYEIERQDFGKKYHAAMKAITIPQNQSEVKSVIADGMDEASATSYFRKIVEDVVGEFELMSKLKGNSNIVSYEDHLVIGHNGQIGWDILIKMEFLTPLIDYVGKNKLSKNDVMYLGIDMCRALELCQKHNIIHRDIKPENIFISENGDFKLGDFGIARTIEKTTGGLSKKGTFTYMAPEVYLGKEYGTTVDIYSLGIVMYWLLNKNRTPFLPAHPAPITHNDKETALLKRMRGDQLPMPSQAESRLSEIVLKMCAFDPKERYDSVVQLREDLEILLPAKSERTLNLTRGTVLKNGVDEQERIEYESTMVLMDDYVEPSHMTQHLSAYKDLLSEEGGNESINIEDKTPDEVIPTNIPTTPKVEPGWITKIKQLNKGVLIGVCTAVILAAAGISWWAVAPKNIPASAIVNVEDTIMLSIGESYQLDPIIEPDETSSKRILYESDATSIATVSTRGGIVANAAGKAIITITVDEVNKTLEVIVEEPEPEPEPEQEFILSTSKVSVDGAILEFDQPLIIVSGATFVPIRAVAEQIGANISWDDATRNTTISFKDKVISFNIGNTKITVRNSNTGEEYEVDLDAPPQTVNGRALLPIRTVLEALGCGVDWNGETNTIVITTPTKTPVKTPTPQTPKSQAPAQRQPTQVPTEEPPQQAPQGDFAPKGDF